MNYEQYIESKRTHIQTSGFDVDRNSLNPMLKDWQGDIVKLALNRGKCALFEDCGLGKTLQFLEWSQRVIEHTGGNVLVCAPLGVTAQTVKEGVKFGYTVNICKSGADVKPGINITNYERVDKFDPSQFSGIVLDESSILKAGALGVTFGELKSFASTINYRLACTATPAPNDFIELLAHAEFLGVAKENEIKALYFTQDGNDTTSWRLKRYAEKEFWWWVSGWAIVLRKPSDLGYSDDGYILPELTIEEIVVDIENPINVGMLIAVEAKGLAEQRRANKASLEQRVKVCADIVNQLDRPATIWCNYNPESQALAKAIPLAAEVTGSDSSEYKESKLLGFVDGDPLHLITKPDIAGHGLNYQHCADIFLVGLGNSYELYYQLLRRSWRFGQLKKVHARVIISNLDGAIAENIRRKEKQAATMFEEIVKATASNVMSHLKKVEKQEMEYKEDVAISDKFTLYLGDSVKQMDKIESNSVGVSVYSPPFPTMYTYTDSPYDAGNVRNIHEMIEQFRYFIDKDHLLRILKPGRSMCVHLTQLTAQKLRDGYVGLKDFRGEVIRMCEQEGWIYYGEVCIDKNPQVKAIRTKDAGLQFKSLATDSARMHMAMADYVLQFRKPGDNPEPIHAGISEKYNTPNGWITQNQWIMWARPVWYSADFMPGTWTPKYTGDTCPDGIKETNVLNVAQARDTNDERHLCPLQLDVIERCIKLWSNPGDVVYSPFAGIGSEGYVAIKHNRKFIGCELKESYWRSAVRNLQDAESEAGQKTLFDLDQYEEQPQFSLDFNTMAMAAD